MADDDRPHFVIPQDHVHTDAVTKTGFGVQIDRPDHGEHGRVLVRRAQEFKAASATSRDSTAARHFFLEVEVAAETTIRAEKQRLSQVGLNVVSYAREDEHSGTARIARAEFDALEGRINRYATMPDHPGKSYLAVVEDLRPVPVREKVPAHLVEPAGDPIDVILYLHAGLSGRETRAIVSELEEYILEAGGEFLGSHRFSSGVTTVRTTLLRELLEPLGREFATLRTITPNRAFFVEDSTRYAAIPNPLTVREPLTDYAVAVVDSGINPACTLLAPALAGVTPVLPPGAVRPDLGHGTFVASRIAYGDDVETRLRTSPVAPRCSLHDVQVFGKDAAGESVFADEHHLAIALDTALPDLPAKVRIVNLSLGSNQPVHDGEFGLVAATLDYLARTHDLLLVTTAGNVRDRQLLAGFPGTVLDPHYRIDPPGESLLALTVGSIAKFADGATQAQLGELSPFSRVGPGSDKGLKPELVAHGGNYVRPGVPHSRFGTQGIHGDGVSLAWDVGTSFAAPLVAQVAAQIQGAYGGIPSNLVKALLLHFAEPAKAPSGVNDTGFMVGMGEPRLEPTVQAKDHSAAFLFTGSLDTESYLHLPFFVPDALGGDHPRSRLRVRCTLVYDPPVNPSQPTEYSQSRIAAKLRKPVEVGFRDVQIGAAAKSYLPWNPIVHFDKLFSHSYAAGEWEIRLRLFTRDLPVDFQQSLAVVIEVIDENGVVDVWSDISAEAGGVFRPMTVYVAA